MKLSIDMDRQLTGLASTAHLYSNVDLKRRLYNLLGHVDLKDLESQTDIDAYILRLLLFAFDAVHERIAVLKKEDFGIDELTN